VKTQARHRSHWLARPTPWSKNPTPRIRALKSQHTLAIYEEGVMLLQGFKGFL
jgi:hypothetical protein